MRQQGIALRAFGQLVAVGRHGYFTNARNIVNRARDFEKFRPQGKLTAGEAHPPKTQFGESGNQSADLRNRQIGVRTFGLALSIGQTIAAPEIADIGQRQTQIFETPSVPVGKRKRW